MQKRMNGVILDQSTADSEWSSWSNGKLEDNQRLKLEDIRHTIPEVDRLKEKLYFDNILWLVDLQSQTQKATLKTHKYPDKTLVLWTSTYNLLLISKAGSI